MRGTQSFRMWAVAALMLVGAVLPRLGAAQGDAVKLPDIEKDADRRIAIGIAKYPDLPAETIGSPAENVLAFDFELSGWFQPVPAGMLPPRTLDDWVRRGAEVLADVERTAGGVRGAVRDTGTGEILFERNYTDASGPLRARLHRFTDDVVLALTGEPGLARTKLVCEWDPDDAGRSEKRLVVMDIDGFAMREFTGEDALELGPRWTADGGSIIYTSYASRYPDVYLHSVTMGTRQIVANHEGLNAHGDLSRDGRFMALTMSHAGNPEIYTKDMASGMIRRLTSQGGSDASPTWSPDGRRIAFVSDRTGRPQIYAMDPDGSNLERLTHRGNYNTAPDWSPDGTRIAYCALRSDGFQIQVLDLRSGQVTTVTDRGGCEDPSWSPDGRSILYSQTAGGRTDLYLTNVNERKALRISRGSGRFTDPDWSPIP